MPQNGGQRGMIGTNLPRQPARHACSLPDSYLVGQKGATERIASSYLEATSKRATSYLVSTVWVAGSYRLQHLWFSTTTTASR